MEDDDDAAFLLGRLLEGDGHRVVRAATLKEADDVLTHVRIGVVLLDFGLPDGNGLELLTRMRLEERTREIPVLAVTGRRTDEGELAAPMVVDWLTKPVDERRLASALRRALPRPAGYALVVEDDPSARAAIVAQMKHLGVECLEAGDGRTAIRHARESSPDLLIFDVGLPGSDGFALVEAIGQGTSGNIPLLVYSTQEPSGSERRALHLGVTRRLAQSRASEQQFLATVRELLSLGVD